jgi:hypothetical protein
MHDSTHPAQAPTAGERPEPCECTKRHEHVQWPGGYPASLAQLSALEVLEALDAQAPREFRLAGPRLVREWRPEDGEGQYTASGPVREVWWDLEYTVNMEAGAKPLQVAALGVAGPDPMGPITRVDWSWGRAHAVAMAYRVLAGLPGSEG